MRPKREFFSSGHNDIIDYNVYQPLALFLEPFIVRHNIIPNEITSTRAFADVGAAMAIVASAADAYNPRRWLWVLCAFLCISYAGMSDTLDGYIARKYELKTVWGGYIDGIADIGGWVVIWLAMLYAFGWQRVLIPCIIWILLGVYAFGPPSFGRDFDARIKLRTFLALNANILPLLVTIFYALYPIR